MRLHEMNYYQRLRLAAAQHRTKDIRDKVAKENGICPYCMRSAKPEHAKYDWACKCGSTKSKDSEDI